ncbi:TetR/AcrR family transcriptional regulator [Nafulsella turpanensis]|uniref:TetR/AcrR family transcriptional regulator n=1 Tax=Nafulsella turpanensis TaxID=1265690 RepID=UPI000346461B|nr:TetR/AcrR family transcriptional regulator [Nafulsella turpanensis]
MNQREKAREEMKEKILLTALQLFSMEGYNGTSMRHIAKEAAISPGLAYNYFSSKEQLLQEIMRKSLEDIQESMKSRGQDPLNLQALMQNMLRLVQQNRSFWRLQHALRMQQSILDLLKEEVETIQAYIIQQLEALPEIERLPNPKEEAQLLFAALDGIVHHFLINKDYPAQRMMDLLLRKYT